MGNMDKKKMKRVVKMCSGSFQEAQDVIIKMSRDEKTELRAYLKGHSVHLDKWVTIMIPFISITIAVLAIICSLSKMSKADQAGIAIFGYGLLILAAAVFVFHIYNQAIKEKYIIMLCYLEEFERVYSTEKMSEDIETYEHMEQRQLKERIEMLDTWKKKQKYVEEQIRLFERNI